jgi:hypothetical protein
VVEKVEEHAQFCDVLRRRVADEGVDVLDTAEFAEGGIVAVARQHEIAEAVEGREGFAAEELALGVV